MKFAQPNVGFPWSAPTWPEGVERPAPERRLGVDYSTEWARSYPARLARSMVLDNLSRPLSHLIASPEVRGAEVLELLRPPVIFVANHSSHMDTPILLSVLPSRFRHNMVVAAAADHFFDRRWKAHIWSFALAVVPIERQRVNRRSADLAANLVEDGWNLLIYPEGGRSPDGWFQPMKGGAAYLAARTGRPVVPVHLRGTYRILPRGGKRLRRFKTTVTFGTPMTASGEEDARALGRRIERALAVLADEAGSDLWSAMRRSASGDTPDPRGPDVSAWRRAWALRQAQREDEKDDGRWAMNDTRRRRWRIEIGRGA